MSFDHADERSSDWFDDKKGCTFEIPTLVEKRFLGRFVVVILFPFRNLPSRTSFSSELSSSS